MKIESRKKGENGNKSYEETKEDKQEEEEIERSGNKSWFCVGLYRRGKKKRNQKNKEKKIFVLESIEEIEENKGVNRKNVLY